MSYMFNTPACTIGKCMSYMYRFSNTQILDMHRRIMPHTEQVEVA